MLSFPLVSFAFPHERAPRFRFAAPEDPSQPTGIPVIVSLEHSTPFEGESPPSPSMEGQAPTLQPSPSRKKSKTAKLAKLNPMKWFKRKKSRTLEPIEVSKERSSLAPHGTPPVSSRLLAQLPGALLERIFSFVCPHTQDESCEQSAVEDTCMLCDLRDLAHCAQVSRQWRFHATNLL
jgi:F-box domain